MVESHKRTLVKTLTFRVVATCTTIAVIYFWSGDWKMATGVGLVLNFVKGIFYYIHERIWNGIHYGRNVKRPKKQ